MQGNEINLDIKRLKEILLYDKNTGIFKWRITRPKAPKGKVAGSLNSFGDVRIFFDGYAYLAHRLAWFYVHGTWPKKELLYKNKDRSCNWIDNLYESDKKEYREASNSLNLNGKRFSSLLVIKRSGFQQHPSKSSHSMFECICSCGKVLNVLGIALTSGNTKSCGCKAIEATVIRSTTHGLTGTRTHRIWQSMLNRCRNKNQPNYINYGGRGISVCDRWKNSFENFLTDMGEVPNNYSIERKNNNGNYNPINCKWADRITQARNTRRNRNITFNGETKCLSAWADGLGINQSSLSERLEKWSLVKALTQPKRIL